MNRIKIGFCKATLRGIARTHPERSWYVERLLSRYFDLSLSSEPDFLFFGEDGHGEHLLTHPDLIRIFITGENAAPNWHEADYALTHERRYDNRHWRVPLHRHWYDTRETKPIRDFEIVRARVSRFCNFIYSNPRAVERIAFLDSLSSYKRVDSGGKIRNNIGGPVLDKMKFIAASKFTIAFENESVSGYATEKIIQPLLVGSIPIYWGDPSIELDFNPEAFVNVHRYSSFDEVVAEIERIDQNEDLWRRYVTAPIFPDGRMPDELTDEALIGFFDSIFRYRRRYVSRSRKFGQRWMHSVKRLQVGIESTRLSRGITRLFRR